MNCKSAETVYFIACGYNKVLLFFFSWAFEQTCCTWAKYCELFSVDKWRHWNIKTNTAMSGRKWDIYSPVQSRWSKRPKERWAFSSFMRGSWISFILHMWNVFCFVQDIQLFSWTCCPTQMRERYSEGAVSCPSWAFRCGPQKTSNLQFDRGDASINGLESHY